MHEPDRQYLEVLLNTDSAALAAQFSVDVALVERSKAEARAALEAMVTFLPSSDDRVPAALKLAAERCRAERLPDFTVRLPVDRLGRHLRVRASAAGEHLDVDLVQDNAVIVSQVVAFVRGTQAARRFAITFDPTPLGARLEDVTAAA